jgi:hypothetical protein
MVTAAINSKAGMTAESFTAVDSADFLGRGVEDLRRAGAFPAALPGVPDPREGGWTAADLAAAAASTRRPNAWAKSTQRSNRDPGRRASALDMIGSR